MKRYNRRPMIFKTFAPRVGAWIETAAVMGDRVRLSRPPRGGVD